MNYKMRYIGNRKQKPFTNNFHNFERNIAFVVGIQTYSNGISRLETPINDAQKLGQLLKDDHDYEVTIQEDPSLNDLNGAFEEFLPNLELGEKDRLILYFAGHGVALDGDDGPEGYLIPADATLNNRQSYYPMKDVYKALSKLKCRHVLVLFDCCFAGTFRWSAKRSVNTLPERIHQGRFEKYIQDKAWQAITSASHDEEAVDIIFGNRGELKQVELANSPFAEALFGALSGKADVIPADGGDGIITATEIYLYLEDKIGTLKQTPSLWPMPEHRKGEYVFFAPGQEINLPPDPELTYENNPYRGLESYDFEHKDLFFGRDELILSLSKVVENRALTIVMGASGTGKSSLVKAGLVPYLTGDKKIEDSETTVDLLDYSWDILPIIRPGKAPVQALIAKLIEHWPELSESIQHADLYRNADGLTRILNEIRRGEPSSRKLIIIDQFEELITERKLVSDQPSDLSEKPESEGDQFSSLLTNAIKNTQDVKFVITVRTDFEGNFSNGKLSELWTEKSRFVVLPMTTAGYREVIEKPALASVLFFEDDKMITKLVDDVQAMPGGLPLLSFTLSELYIMYIDSKRKDRTLNYDDFTNLGGGVVGSLQSRADDELAKLKKETDKELLKKIMLRMISLEGGGMARRQVAKDELIYPSEGETKRAEEILSQMVEARLLVTGNLSTGEPSYQPAHDALVSTWAKLHNWRIQAQEYLPLQRRLNQAASDWEFAEDAEARDGLLWSGDPRLLILLEQIDKGFNDQASKGWLNKRESAFVNASNSKRLYEIEEEEKRRQELLKAQTERAKEAEEREQVEIEARKQAEDDALRVRNRNRIAIGLLILALIAAAFATLFGRQSSNRAFQLNLANNDLQSQLVHSFGQEISNEEPLEALALGIEAVRMANGTEVKREIISDLLLNLNSGRVAYLGSDVSTFEPILNDSHLFLNNQISPDELISIDSGTKVLLSGKVDRKIVVPYIGAKIVHDGFFSIDGSSFYIVDYEGMRGEVRSITDTNYVRPLSGEITEIIRFDETRSLVIQYTAEPAEVASFLDQITIKKFAHTLKNVSQIKSSSLRGFTFEDTNQQLYYELQSTQNPNLRQRLCGQPGAYFISDTYNLIGIKYVDDACPSELRLINTLKLKEKLEHPLLGFYQIPDLDHLIISFIDGGSRFYPKPGQAYINLNYSVTKSFKIQDSPFVLINFRDGGSELIRLVNAETVKRFENTVRSSASWINYPYFVIEFTGSDDNKINVLDVKSGKSFFTELEESLTQGVFCDPYINSIKNLITHPKLPVFAVEFNGCTKRKSPFSAGPLYRHEFTRSLLFDLNSGFTSIDLGRREIAELHYFGDSKFFGIEFQSGAYELRYTDNPQRLAANQVSRGLRSIHAIQNSKLQLLRYQEQAPELRWEDRLDHSWLKLCEDGIESTNSVKWIVVVVDKSGCRDLLINLDSRKVVENLATCRDSLELSNAADPRYFQVDFCSNAGQLRDQNSGERIGLIERIGYFSPSSPYQVRIDSNGSASILKDENEVIDLSLGSKTYQWISIDGEFSMAVSYVNGDLYLINPNLSNLTKSLTYFDSTENQELCYTEKCIAQFIQEVESYLLESNKFERQRICQIQEDLIIDLPTYCERNLN